MGATSPRRLISTIALPPSAATSANASRVRGCSGPGTARRACRRSPPAAAPAVHAGGSSSRSSACQLSGRGVAVPAEQHRAGLGRTSAGDLTGVVARVALLLVGGVVLLVDHDQARSMTGAKTAERGPTQILASPERSRRHSS